jgi:phosphatidate phosphatase PAH1
LKICPLAILGRGDSFGDFIQDLQSGAIDQEADDRSSLEDQAPPDLVSLPFPTSNLTTSPDQDLETEIAEPQILANQANNQDFDAEADTQIAAFRGAPDRDLDQSTDINSETTEAAPDDLMSWLESSADNLQASIGATDSPTESTASLASDSAINDF